jgi:glutathione S-transferase
VLWALGGGLPACRRLLALEISRPEYLRVQPFGQIPAIDDEGFALFESAAIVLYLAEKSGQLLPTSLPGRALAAQWTFAAVNSVEPALAELFSLDRFAADQAWAKERRPAVVAQAEARLATLEVSSHGAPTCSATRSAHPTS